MFTVKEKLYVSVYNPLLFNFIILKSDMMINLKDWFIVSVMFVSIGPESGQIPRLRAFLV